MPAAPDHETQARHNEALVQFVINSPFTDWAATGIFYAAVHYIEAWLDRNFGEHSQNHSERYNHIRRRIADREFFRRYSQLLNRSFFARYLDVRRPSSATGLTPSQFFDQAELNRLLSTLQWLKSWLGYP